MKIFAISPEQSLVCTRFSVNNKKEKANVPTYNSSDILKTMSQMSYKNISFGNSDFDRTVEKNYFKLPKGATPDIFQKAAAQNILLENDVLVTAPTGTGKTAIAHYAINKNLREGKKTFYTAPLKALSNEKFRDFQRIYGEENVGILTGDTKINADAPIVIMTTEVYRNMVFGEHFGRHNDMLDDLGTVIFDELHYLGDVDRGGIWEQSIFLTDPSVQLLSLSATIGNNKDIAGWMAEIRKHIPPEIVKGSNTELAEYRADKNKPVHTVLIDVPNSNRHVPLEFENINVSELEQPQKSKKKNSKFNSQLDKLAKIAEKKELIPAYSYVDVVRKLRDNDRLPAIFFVFDKKNSKDILDYLTKYSAHLTTDEEKEQIAEILERYEQEGKYLGETLNIQGLFKGYAVHNAGLLPNQKELVEELFQKKLVKVVIATETLSAGINMPTRTTVITSTRKPSDNPDGPDNKRTLSPNEFHQMAGRAGRRGIDKIGYCYTLSRNNDEKIIFDNLVKSSPNSLRSSFQPDYSFITKYYEACQGDEMLNLICDKSFYTYNKDEKKRYAQKLALRSVFDRKIRMLKAFGYISPQDRLTEKGCLISDLNGYAQIPVVEMLSSHAFEKLNPVELAAAVGALANIENKKEDKFIPKFDEPKKSFAWKTKNIEKYVEKLNDSISKYNSILISQDKKAREIEVNEDLADYIYKWAERNFNSENSTGNWSNLYYMSDPKTYKDEGTMFKGIMMTVDLLRQLKLVCKHGAKISNDPADSNYYYNLIDKIDEAIYLINKEPAVG